MKNVLTIIFLLALNFAQGQEVKYFQHRFNLDVNPVLRNERFNSGIRTRSNFDVNNPYYYVGIGTSYNNLALDPPHDVADRLRFTRMNTLGNIVLDNFGYHFIRDGKELNSSGVSIAEIGDVAGNGGYVAVGAVTDNNITGAVAAGGSDILFTRLTANGAVAWARRIDGGGTSDISWCIKRSNIMDGDQPTWLICGQSKQGAAYTDCFVARVTANGIVVWFQRYNFDPGGGQFNSAHCIAKQLCEDADGYIYVVGTLQDNTGANGIDGLAFKLDQNGAVQWANNYHSAPVDELQAVRLTNDGNLIVGGFTNDGGMFNMQITKLSEAAGVILFQNILRARIGDLFLPAKCYDILEVPGSGYYLAGLLIQNGVNREMMYRAGAGGIGINWNGYNPMNYSVGFGIDYAPGDDCPGIAYFSSMKNPAAPAFSDGHIMKTDLAIRTCNFLNPKQPVNAESHLVRHERQHLCRGTVSGSSLQSARFNYLDWPICWEGCDNHNPDAASPKVQLPVIEQSVTAGSLKISPNPVSNTLHVQVNSLPAGEYQIELIDMKGRLIQKRTNVINGGSLTTDLDMSSVTPGVYLFKISQGTYVLQQKVVKQ